MDEMMLLRMLGGGFGSGFELTALIAFIGFAVIYLLVPVLGYRPRRPAGMILAMYLLIAYGGLALVQSLVQWLQILDRPGQGGFGRGGDGGIHLLFTFAILKLALFLVALGSFVSGLRSLHWMDPRDELPHETLD